MLVKPILCERLLQMHIVLPPTPHEAPRPLSGFAKERALFETKERALKRRRRLRRLVLLKLWLRDPRRALQRVLNRLHKGADQTHVLHSRRAFDT